MLHRVSYTAREFTSICRIGNAPYPIDQFHDVEAAAMVTDSSLIADPLQRAVLGPCREVLGELCLAIARRI